MTLCGCLAFVRFETPGYLVLLALLLCVNWYIAGVFLYSSAARGQTRILQWVLWSHPGSVNARDDWGDPPLDYARGDEVKYLLRKHGAKHGWELDGEAKPCPVE